MENKENMTPLSLDEMEQASGGTEIAIRILNVDVRSGPGLNYPVIATLSSGVTINYTNAVVTNKEDGKRWVMINRPTHGWVDEMELGI